MKNKIALVTGSFDPITVGHLDIVNRAAKIFDKVIVVVAHNEEKTYLFSPSERVAIAAKAVEKISGATVELCDGYVADFAKECGADAFVRGIRSDADVLYEQNMAQINLENSGVDTLMLFAKPQYHSISSTLVRNVLKDGGDIFSLMENGSAALALEYFAKKSSV